MSDDDEIKISDNVCSAMEVSRCTIKMLIQFATARIFLMFLLLSSLHVMFFSFFFLMRVRKKSSHPRAIITWRISARKEWNEYINLLCVRTGIRKNAAKLIRIAGERRKFDTTREKNKANIVLLRLGGIRAVARMINFSESRRLLDKFTRMKHGVIYEVSDYFDGGKKNFISEKFEEK